jgi:tRNA pseudouridine13 synthase
VPDPFTFRPQPLLTGDLPGTGGRLVQLEDFQVEEIPAYLPCGEGDHCMALVEKRGLTTPQALRKLCEAAGAAQRDAGYAGLKDKLGVTRQWFSLAGVTPDRLLALELPELRVLSADLHKNKLRTGHLRGNRFTVTLRGVAPDAATRAAAIVARLEAEGLANFYGAQRFGRQGDNARRGLELLQGAKAPRRDKQQRRLMISALQSHLFNAVLSRRLELKAVRRLLGGEVLQLSGSSALFVSEDAAVDGQRLADKELVVTGPICGPRMTWPLAGSPARELEETVFANHGVRPEQFAALGRLGRGGRRPLTVEVGDAAVEAIDAIDDGEPALRLRFALPAGTYATVLLQELAKGDVRGRDRVEA